MVNEPALNGQGDRRLSDSNRTATLLLDGKEVVFQKGEMLLKVARNAGRKIPTLCYNPRLKPFGGCRLCVVEIEGCPKPVASCTTEASSGMVVKTSTPELERHRKAVLNMVASQVDNLDNNPVKGLASTTLENILAQYDIDPNQCPTQRAPKGVMLDDNPFIERNPSLCIACYLCVRICNERQMNSAIGIVNRGFHTKIATEFNGSLRESACVFCGQCIQACPTGALADKKAMARFKKELTVKKTRSVCAYCGVGCSIDILTQENHLIGVQPALDGPANHGALCMKGQFAFDFVDHEDRLKTPLIRDESGTLRNATWDEALDRAASGFQRVIDKHGRHSIYAIASGRAPNEASYVLQKLMRAGFGTHHVDNCSRT